MQKRFRLQGLYWLHNPKSFQDNIKEIHYFADFCVQNALERARRRKSDDTAPRERYIFLDELINVTKDPIELRSQLLNILLAGRDTTASLVSWALWLLAKYPDTYNTLRSHILKDFGASEQKDRMTFEALKDCKYLQYVMKEVLRLYPPTPINSRTAIRDTSLPLGGGPDGKSPIFVRKGQTVVYYVHITHTLDEFWGPDANNFDPSRWANHRKHDWTYLPFSGGPRICLGQQFALTEAGYIITRIVQKFDQAKLADPSAVPNHRLGITDAPNDYMVYFHEAPIN
ncbi:hypothetical protein BBP40_007178 [Aspergillus hancockii]|nr:hypothetical protein BBP40_007178 [Aspergillus hancockii]